MIKREKKKLYYHEAWSSIAWKTNIESDWLNINQDLACIGLVESRMIVTWHSCTNAIWWSSVSHVS